MTEPKRRKLTVRKKKPDPVLTFDKDHPDMPLVWWVGLAVSKEEFRYNLKCIEVKDNTFTATDGHRLHSYRSENRYGDGLYNIATLKKTAVVLTLNTEALEFPDWRGSVIPKEPFMWKDTLHLDTVNGRDESAYARITKALPEDRYLRWKYVHDIAKANQTFEVRVKDGDSAVTFKSESCFALIMPMRS